MSDLISRSEALQRLIQETVDSKNNLIHINTIKRLLQDVESAYDIDKIVEELEEMIHPKQLYFCKYARGGCKHLYNNDKDCMECIVENAIEIVKAGVKNE